MWERAGTMSSSETRLPGVYAIGLTGGIATGKSTVSSILASLGAEVIDADRISRQVTADGSPHLELIARVFGSTVLNPDGSLNRAKMAKVVFSDEDARRKLEAIIHPLVIDRIREVLARLSDDAKKDGRLRIAVLDIPLLFESGAENLADETWVVYVDRETQVRRLMEREGYVRDDADSRIDAQMPLSEKVKRATEVIDNQDDLMATRRRVEELWAAVKRKTSGYTRIHKDTFS
jgi:dephospho-CoA kinase